MITLGIPSLVLLGLAVVLLIAALFMYPRTKQARYRIDEVTFHDDTIVYYLMYRASFGRWKVLLIDGVRGYRDLDEAKTALHAYLTDECDLEISETRTIKEYG